MRGAEAIKEVEERDGGLQCGQVRDQREVHDFLHGSGGQHRKAGLAAAHDVAVVAEDGQRMRRQCARAHMEHAGQQLARDLVHVRDHEQQTLRRGKRRGQCARLERTVHCARSAALALHLRDAYLLAEQIDSAVGRPVIRDFRHRGRRRDRVDCRHVGKCIRDVGCGSVAVDGHGLSHFYASCVFSRFVIRRA